MADFEINILTNDSGVPLVETKSTNLYAPPSAFDKIREDIEINKQNISNNTSRIEINERNIANNNERIAKNEENILTNTNSIESNKNEIDVLKQLVTISERYIDKYTGTESVEDFILTINYPNIQNGDVIIYVQLIEQGTDKIYKIIRSVDNWVSYEIPAVEAAEFDSLGSIVGTYKLNDDKYSELPFLVKIESGIIKNIYIKKENNEYIEINNYLKEIDNIKDDYITSNLLNQALTLYMTKEDGASKNYVKTYALPKTIFGDVNYYTNGDFVTSIPNYNEPIASTEPLIEPGNYILKEVDKIFNYSFEIGKNNSLINNIWLSSSQDVEIKLKISAYYKRFNSKALLYYSSIDESGYDELGSIITTSTTIKDGALVNVSTPLTFSSLENNIINMEANSIIKIKIEVISESSSGAIISLYSNEAYPSSMQLSSWAIVDYVTKATKLSQLENDLGFIDKNVDDLTNYYDKNLTYSREELDARISAIPKYKTLVVNELPEIGEVDTIYLVPDADSESGNLYTEYFYVNNNWEMLGTQRLDLSGYALKSTVDEHIANKDNPHQVTKAQVGLGSVVNAGQAATMSEGSLDYYTAGAAYSDIKPIQEKAHEHNNKAVLDTIDGFVEGSALILEDKPTENSSNLVSSGGVYSALEKKQNVLAFDDSPIQGSNNPVTSKGIYNALSQKQNTLILDTSVTEGSSNPVTSGAVYNELIQKANKIDVDNSISNLNNVVSGKQDTLTENQLNAVNSGITSSLVNTFNNKQDALNSNQLNAVNSGITSSLVSTFNNKQNALNEAQLNAVNSGITSSLVSTFNNKQNALNSNQLEAVNSGITSGLVSTFNNKQNALNEKQLNAVNSNITSDLVQKITSNETNIETINNKIPNQATNTNQLADKDFVNSSLNSIAAFYITKNANGDSFSNKAELSSATTFYSGGATRVPTRNDYCIVLVDESKDNSTTRYIYNNGWEFQYVVNETALTSEQLKAINSGITKDLVSTFKGKQDKITKDNKLDFSLIDNVPSIPANYVTTDTPQTITGYKTFDAPANIGSTEQLTVKFMTANGGSVSFGKEAANSGSMIRFDQEDGTCRLRFRGSGTPGAIVWEQPEAGAALYFDLGNGNNKQRIAMPSKQGTLALKSDIPALTFAVESDITNIWTTE